MLINIICCEKTTATVFIKGFDTKWYFSVSITTICLSQNGTIY